MPVSTGPHTSFQKIPASSSIPAFQHGSHGAGPNNYTGSLPVHTGQSPVTHSSQATYNLPGYMQKQHDNSEKIDRLVEQMAKMQDLLSEVTCARADEKTSSTEMEDENNNKRLSSSTHSRSTGTNIDSSDSSSPIRRQQAPVTRRTTSVKIPPFTGKEDWRVWLHRFEDISERRGWNEATKLDG